jgi:cardiolipin synthase
VIGNLPNILTIVRILLLPLFAATLIYGNYFYALIIFLVASVTDFFDGLIARMRKEITLFGSILDPVADKFFLITSFTIMPNLFGKIASALQFVLIGLVLLLINFGNGFTIPRIFLIAIAVITAISGIYYIYQGLRAADIEST